MPDPVFEAFDREQADRLGPLDEVAEAEIQRLLGIVPVGITGAPPVAGQEVGRRVRAA